MWVLSPSADICVLTCLPSVLPQFVTRRQRQRSLQNKFHIYFSWKAEGRCDTEWLIFTVNPKEISVWFFNLQRNDTPAISSFSLDECVIIAVITKVVSVTHSQELNTSFKMLKCQWGKCRVIFLESKVKLVAIWGLTLALWWFDLSANTGIQTAANDLLKLKSKIKISLSDRSYCKSSGREKYHGGAKSQEIFFWIEITRRCPSSSSVT